MEALKARGMDEWSQLCSDCFVPLRADGDDSFLGSVRTVDLGGVGVSVVQCTRSRVYRPASLIASEPRDDVLLSVQLRGRGVVSQSGRVAELVPGAAAMYEADRAYELRFDRPMTELVLQVPRARLPVRDRVIHGSTATAVPDGPHLTILRHLLSGVLSAGELAPETGHDLGSTAIELLASALWPFVGTETSPRAFDGESLYQAARAHVQRHHADLDLDVGQVARNLGVSRRHLEVQFARHGESPAAHLRHVRLQRAADLLLGSERTVLDVSRRVGFADVNTFIRAFRRERNVTPEQWRREQVLVHASTP